MIIVLLSVLAIDIPQHARVPMTRANCAWACLETMANVHGIAELKGTQANNALAYDDAIAQYLTKKNVKFRLTKQRSFEQSNLEQYANSHGVAVAFKPGNPHSNFGHMVVVTYYSNSIIQFYDPAQPQRKNFTCGRAWFDKWWAGNSVVLLTK